MKNEGYLFKLPPPVPLVDGKRFRERNPIWTGCKAKLIERYLFFFVQVTFHGTYIDGFAGPQETDKHEMWAAKLVLESRPRWLRNFFLFELKQSSLKALEQLRDAQEPPLKAKKEPKRKVVIYPGDFNTNIATMLKEYPIPDKEATFCLLDQRTFECDWATVKLLATHKQGGNKIELFYFFPEGWIDRSIEAVKRNKNEKLERWWGACDWLQLRKTQGAVRAQLVAKRFRTELNYRYAYPFAIYEKEAECGRVMYYMIHASDHPEAPALMSRAYGKALDLAERPQQLDLLKEAYPTLAPLAAPPVDCTIPISSQSPRPESRA